MEQDHRGEAPDRHNPDAVGGDHQAPAIPAVGGNAGQDAEEWIGHDPRERDGADLRRRMRHRQHEERVRDRRRLRSDARKQLPGLEQQKVPIAPKRNPAHRR